MKSNFRYPARRHGTGIVALAFLLALFAALSCFPARAQNDARPTLRVGMYQNEPKIFMDESGQARGFFPNLLRAIADAERWDLKFVPGTWRECLERLDRGELDLMPDVCFTEDRARKYALNREPVLSDWFGVYARPGVAISSLLDMEGKRVALLNGSVQEELFKSMVTGFGFAVNIIAVDDYETGAKLVESEKADALVVNRFAGLRLKQRYALRDTAIIFNPTHLHFAAQSGSQKSVLDAIDRHLIEWKADPNSIYYLTLKENIGDAPTAVIPPWFWKGLAGVLAVLLVAGALILLLKWQVNRRTADLQERTRELEDALESLKMAQEKAIQQERLHALGQMASGVAHDFNNMLTIIIGWSSLLLREPANAGEHEILQEGLQKIDAAAKDGARIVDRLRAFYRQRLNVKTYASVLPAEMARRAIELMKPRWTNMKLDGPIEVKTAIEDGPLILADAADIQEALVNLISNSIDAMAAGGTLTVSVSAPAKNAVSISVQDTGIGMSDEVRLRSAKAFYTTKGPSGTGMGLTMVAEICERYGGRLDIRSKPGAGTTVTMVFPAIRDTAHESEEKAPDAPRIRPLKILAVDDEPLALEVLIKTLSSDGHQVDGETNPLRAPQKLALGQYDLVITDWFMPGMSGLQLFEHFTRTNPSVPVLILSGSPEVDTNGAREHGLHTLRKPVQRDELARAFMELGFAAEPG